MKKILFIALIFSVTLLKAQKSTSINSKDTIEKKNKYLKIKMRGDSVIELEDRRLAIHTVFNLPIVRYNINRLTTNEDVLGSLEYFNSIGAGLSLSYGKINIKAKEGKSLDDYTTMEDDRTLTMKNNFGISLGVLFSKNDSIGGNRLIFAPTIALQILDFQIGYGYELGTAKTTTRRSFFTLSYGIPLNKFTEMSSYLFRDGKSKEIRVSKKRLYNYNGLF
jgi:hypothetical protein